MLGLIGKTKEGSLRSLTNFLGKQNLIPLQIQEAWAPIYSRGASICRRLGKGRVYLVGDAAGHVKTTTVGGVIAGFRGALAVAEAIVKGRVSPDLRRLQWELLVNQWIRKALNRFTTEDYVQLLELLNPMVKRSLGIYNRDQAIKIVWKACFHQPRIFLLGLRALLLGH